MQRDALSSAIGAAARHAAVPEEQDVPLDGRTRQQNAYGNVMYIHNRYFQVGCEVAHLWVGFKGDERQGNSAWVFQNKIIFSF